MAATATSSHQVIVTAMAELIGVSVLAIIADTSEGAGKVMLALMATWLLLYLMTTNGSAFVNSLSKKLGGSG